MNDDIAAVVAAVGPRLAGLRRRHGLTLTAVAERVGTSMSTLSRLESGHRRPTLELLVALSRVYDVTLDELIGGRQADVDPQQVEVLRTDDMIVWRLSRSPGQPMALKIAYPASYQAPPDPLPVHEGYKWIYVLSGRLRMILADQDVILSQGESAEIDTRLPHWTGSAGEGTVEILALYGRQGERALLRARPPRSGL